jgi:hypothetical protein
MAKKRSGSDWPGPRVSQKGEPKKTVYRDSRDGQFITKREAEQRPKTSEKERVRIRPPESPKKR